MPELIPAEPGTHEWLAARRDGVTATDIVAICGLSSWQSAYSLYWQKTGQTPETPDSDRFRLGRELEPYVMDRWLEVNAYNDGGSLDLWYKAGPGLFRSTSRPWQMATLDALTGRHPRYRDTPLTELAEPLELKSWADADRHAWDTAPPPAVRAQVLWQMDVMDVGVGHVGVVFLPSGEFRSYVIEHDESPVKEYPHDIPGPLASGICRACADLELMRERGAEFYARLQGELPPPPVDASEATTAALKAIHADAAKGKRVPIDRAVWIHYTASADEAESALADKRAWENQIREAIGVATEIEVDGQLVARRRVYDSPVKAHVRHVDGLWRVKNGDDHE